MLGTDADLPHRSLGSDRKYHTGTPHLYTYHTDAIILPAHRAAVGGTLATLAAMNVFTKPNVEEAACTQTSKLFEAARI